jgi:hypothetical protein
MRRQIALVIVGASLPLAACGWRSEPRVVQPPPVQAQRIPAIAPSVNDVPVPPGSAVDADRTVIAGPDGEWFGRLAFATSYSMDDISTFYQREMPRYGWISVASARSATRVLSFERGNRIATVQVRQRPGAGAEVEFWVNPRGSSDPQAQSRAPGPEAGAGGANIIEVRPLAPPVTP